MKTIFNSQLSNSIDGVVKDVPKSSHSTDTEPEAENNNSNNKCSQMCLTSNVQFQNCTNIKGKKKVENVFEDFIEGIPSYEYDEKQIRRNQIKNKSKKNKVTEKVELKNNRFFNYYEGFLSIAEHCHKNQISFTRDKCKEYLKESYIIDFSRDCFIPATTNLKPKQFNKYYRYAQREMKHL